MWTVAVSLPIILKSPKADAAFELQWLRSSTLGERSKVKNKEERDRETKREREREETT